MRVFESVELSYTKEFILWCSLGLNFGFIVGIVMSI